MKYFFLKSHRYSRDEIAEVVGMKPFPKGGSWFTGYSEYNVVYFIFCGVNTAGRTGHDYGNHFDGEELIWSGKTGSHRGQPMIRKMTAIGAEVHLFWRRHDRDRFEYAGLARPVSISDDIPVIIRWRFDSVDTVDVRIPEEVTVNRDHFISKTIMEGAVIRITVNAYERNSTAKKACLEAYGYRCAVCDFDFEEVYGDVGKGYIHVHHIKPLCSIKENYVVDPINDLVPLCPNCHAMVHRTDPPMNLDDLRSRIRINKNK